MTTPTASLDLPASPAADLAAVPTPDLLAELQRILVADLLPVVRRLAAVWGELERRGVDLSDLRQGVCRWLPRIAAGTLTPEAAVRYGTRPSLLALVSSLPPADQLALLASGGVRVVVPADGGGYTHRLMPAEALTLGQQRQVFAAGALRSDAEQIAVLEDRRSRPAKVAAEVRRGKATADRRAGGVRVGKVTVAVGDIVAALADLKPAADDGPTSSLVACSVTEAQHLRLKAKAGEAGVSVAEMVRLALRAASLI